MPPTREGGVFLSVEDGASGADAVLDGNDTNLLVSWMFPNEGWKLDRVPQMLDQLMMWTAAGHLAWVVFPPQGFRLEQLVVVSDSLL